MRELLPPPIEAGGVIAVQRSSSRWSPDGEQILYKQYKTRWVEVVDPERGKVLTPMILEYRYFICDKNGNTVKTLNNIPKNWNSQGVSAWMDNGESVLFSGREIELNVPFAHEWENGLNIYKYHITTGKITRLTNHPGRDYHLDWISDQTYAVTPAGKKKVQWGTLKQQNSE